ncbi:type II toxin-antitoxin system Phd/YefM family antitoxin [Kineococcus gypseus]|uniref:type II toxin-antitoxin system Phd/YefM family antitoxin n=1 Tax=Kineococcus gypseus TaxID=1637102 RepID=UPI003D7CDFAC
MRTIRVRDLRDHCAQLIREVEAGETFTVTSHGRPVATLAPVRPPSTGPRTFVPADEVAGALSHLGPGLAEGLRRDLAGFDLEDDHAFERRGGAVPGGREDCGA